MNKIKWVDLTASICLLAGSVMNIVELFVDVHFIFSASASALVLISVFLWLVACKRKKTK